MKIDWNLLLISVVIAAIGSGLVYVAFQVQEMFPIWLSAEVSILSFFLLVIGIYIIGEGLKKSEDYVVSEKSEIKVPKIMAIFPIIAVISLSLGWFEVGGSEMTGYWWWIFVVSGLITFCILLAVMYLEEKNRKK